MSPETDARNIRGRFAPSPTGALHAGSLIAALGSCLSARARGGHWLLRMEDLDTPRCSPQAADRILRQLEHLGFEWDGAVVYQSQRMAAYHAALHDLQTTGKTYPCTCSRREWLDNPESRVYPGTCRQRSFPVDGQHAVRLRVGHADIGFTDRIQGPVRQALGASVGDFVLLRADLIIAYQLAVVVDDAESGITEVVRGADLLDSTPRQIYLQQQLGLPTPSYAHLPVLVNAQGQKLSKQTLARPVAQGLPLDDLRPAMAALSHPVPADIDSRADFWSWALTHWSEARIPKQLPLPLPQPD